MRWQLLIVSTVWASLVAGGGCATDQSLLTPQVRQALAQHPIEPAPTVTRSQKGEPAAELRPVAYLKALPNDPNVANEGRVAASIRATVNNVPIFDEEVQATSYQFLMAIRGLPEPDFSQKKRAIEKEMLDQLIDRELILQDAAARLKKAGPKVLDKLKQGANKEFDKRWVRQMMRGNKIKSDAEFKEMLRQQGLSLDMIRRQWVRQFMATEYLRSRIQPYVDRTATHEQMLDYYERHQTDFKIDDSVQWQDIFISASGTRYKTREEARKAAEEVVRRLRNGEEFTALCERYDDGLSHFKGGKGDGERRGDIRPEEVEAHLFRMRPGDVGPVIELGSGFHVIKLVKREYAGFKEFSNEDVQTMIRNKLRGEASVRETKKIITDLKPKAIIEYARPKF